MGTNYYHVTDHCSQCDRYDERHIGKSSHGWKFTVRALPAEGVNGWRSMKQWLRGQGGKVVDEYGQFFSVEEFIDHEDERSARMKVNDSLHGGDWNDAEGHHVIDREFC